MHINPHTGVEAEAELLSALTTFFGRVGLTPDDVGLKVSSRKVLGAVLERYGVPPENFAQVSELLRLQPFDAVQVGPAPTNHQQHPQPTA